MKIKVSNCRDCPFIVEDLDHNSTGKELCISCNLLKFLKLERMDYHTYRCFDYDEWFNKEYLEPLEKCPLKNMDKIEIQYNIKQQNEKYYIDNHIKYIPEVKENDIIYFEMPGFCSGEYETKVFKDEQGLYINKKENYFKQALDYRLNKPYWSKNY